MPPRNRSLCRLVSHPIRRPIRCQTPNRVSRRRTVGGRNFLGEFEQRVLLAILRCDAKAYPIEIRKEIGRASGHEPSRGAFYTTLDRLEAKKLVRWTAEGGDAGRDGLPQRKFIVTPEGVKALRASRKALLELWSGLEDVLAES